jgi:hypothetical protein
MVQYSVNFEVIALYECCNNSSAFLNDQWPLIYDKFPQLSALQRMDTHSPPQMRPDSVYVTGPAKRMEDSDVTV